MNQRTFFLLIITVLLLVACLEEQPESASVSDPNTSEATTAPTDVPTSPATAVAEESAEMLPDPTENMDDVAETVADSEAGPEFEMAAISPPPQLSDRELGVHVVPCPPNRVPGADEVEGESYYCGVFTVPQNWDAPDDRKLDLSFVVVKASSDVTEPDPLMFLAGGPGQSAILFPTAVYDTLRPTKDIIRLDQRGTGFSQRLGLEECLVLATQNGAPDSQIEVVRAGLNAFDPAGLDIAAINQICWDLFAGQGLDLNQFNTSSSTRDVVELIKALDYDTFNLHGVSYGTRLAMNTMRELPEIADAPQLRSVVLDSAFPPSIYMLSSLPRSDHDFILQLLDDCESSDVCRDAYPNLGERLGALLQRLEQEPISHEGGTVTQADLVATLSNLGNTRAGYMPKLIMELEMGSLDTYSALANREVGSGDPEGVAGLDRSDPVQAFLGDAVKLAGGGDDIGVMFTFVSGVEEAAAQEDPISAVDMFIRENFVGDTQTELLALLSDLTPGDFAESSYFAQPLLDIAADGTTADISSEEQAAIDLASQRTVAVLGIPLPLYYTIHCQEDLQFESAEAVIDSVRDLEYPQFVDVAKVQATADGCLNWPVEPAPLTVKNPVVSDVPTLILQGAYDEATPVYMGQLAATELENSTYILVPQQGHEIWKSAGGCVGQIASSFVLNPEADLDLSCLDIRQPQWALPDE